MKLKLKAKSLARDTALEVTVSRIIHYMHENNLHSAHSQCKPDLDKWKLAYIAMYEPNDGPLRNFQPCTTAGREYVFIRKHLKEMVEELNKMNEEAVKADKLPSANAAKGSELYALSNAIKTSSNLAKKVDAMNAAKLKRSMDNVEKNLGLRSEGSLTPPPLIDTPPPLVDFSTSSFSAGADGADSDEEFNLPKNSGPYAPNRVRVVHETTNVGGAARNFFGSGQKRKAPNDSSRRVSPSSNTGLTFTARTGVVHRREPGLVNRDMIDRIDNGNDVVTENIARLQTVLDGRNNRGGLATTGQVLSNVGNFISSVSGTNNRLSERAQVVGEKLLEQIISQAGLE